MMDYQACYKALEASSLQCHAKQAVDLLEFQANDKANVMARILYNRVAEKTGYTILEVAGVTAKVFRDRSIVYPIIKKSKGLRPAVTTSVGMDSGSVQLGWDLQ